MFLVPKLLYKSEMLLFNGLIQVLQNMGVNASRNLLKASSGAKCYENVLYIYLWIRCSINMFMKDKVFETESTRIIFWRREILI